MLRIYGNMQLAQVAGTKDEIEGLRLEAKKGGQELLVEDGNFLYARAIFMGYDLPNGNGDAIPSIYAGTFGPSFIGKHVDVNHQLDPDSIIGRIMATWHVQKPIVAGDGPRVIGRNVFGRDIEGRAKVFGFAPSVEAEPMELQLEGIFRIDRSSHAGDIMARKLIAKEIDSVSQEASTAYCLCPICAHKISLPWDQPCDHLRFGSLMVKAFKVQGYEHEILAYKVHHEPGGTGLGCVGVPAYDKAKIPELVAALRAGNLSVEAFKKLLHEQELVWGKSQFVIQASRELELVASDLAKPSTSKAKGPENAPLTPGTTPTGLTPGTTLTSKTPSTPGTPLASGLREVLNSLIPVEGDTKVSVYHKLVSTAKAQGRLNRETMSLTRHVALASVSPESEKEGALDLLAARVAVVAETQATLDLARRYLLAALELDQKKPGASDGQLVGADALGAIKTLGMAMKVGVTRTALKAAKNRVDGFMPGVRSLQQALHGNGRVGEGIDGALKVSELFASADHFHAEFGKRFDRWTEAGFPSDTDKVQGHLAKEAMTALVAFKVAYNAFSEAQTRLLPDGHDLVAQVIDKEFGLQGLAPAPRRLRMRAGTMDLVAAFQGHQTEERSRAVVGAFSSSTSEWLPDSETRTLVVRSPTTSAEAAELVNGLSEIVAAMGRQTFVGGLKAGVQKRLDDARKDLTLLAAKERVAAGRRALARIWLKAFAINPSFDVKGSAPQVLAESKIGFSAELAAEVGAEVQQAGGPWPWVGEKAVSWSEFVASKTDEELIAVHKEWRGRFLVSKDDLAREVIVNNAAKLIEVHADRLAARGLVARFFRQPVLADSHWTLFDAEGKAVGRFTLAATARGRLDRHVEIGGKKVFLASWLQSQQYGRDIVAHARRHGLTATLRLFDSEKPEVKAGGGAGISFEDFEIADGGEGVVQADGSIKWNRFPTLASFSAHGYMDGMSKVRGSLIEIVGVDSNLKGDVKPGDKVSLRKIDFKPVWQGGWIRSTPKAGDIIHLETKYSDVLYMVDAEEEHDSFEVEVSGALDVRVTEDFVDFYNDVFEYPTIEDEDVMDFAEANEIPLPENQSEFDALRQRLVEYHYENAQTNWSASLRRRVRATAPPVSPGRAKELEHVRRRARGEVFSEDPKKEARAQRLLDKTGDRLAPGWRERRNKVQEATHPNLTDYRVEDAGAGFRADGESCRQGNRKPYGKDEHNHGTGSDSIRHSHGAYEKGHKHEPVEDRVLYSLDRPAWREGEGVQEQGHVGEGRGRRWAAEKLLPGDYGTERGTMPLGRKKFDRGHVENYHETPAVRTPEAAESMRKHNKLMTTLEEARRQADTGAISPEHEAHRKKMKGAAVYRPQTGAEHGAFVALVSAVADALEQDPEFEEVASNFPMSGVELTETIPGEFATANVDFKEFVDMLVPDAQEVIDAYDKAFAGKTTMQALADEFGDKVWSSAILSAMGHGVSIYDEPGVTEKLKELGLDKVRPSIHKDDMGYDEAWQALTKYASQGD